MVVAIWRYLVLDTLKNTKGPSVRMNITVNILYAWNLSIDVPFMIQHISESRISVLFVRFSGVNVLQMHKTSKNKIKYYEMNFINHNFAKRCKKTLYWHYLPKNISQRCRYCSNVDSQVSIQIYCKASIKYVNSSLSKKHSRHATLHYANHNINVAVKTQSPTLTHATLQI